MRLNPEMIPNNGRRGFTLLELIIVIAILAVIGGAALVAYDGLDKRAAKGQGAFNLAAIDKGVRVFKVVSGGYPTDLDSLVLSDTAITSPTNASAGGLFSRLTPELQGADGVKATADGLLAYFNATAEVATALKNAGITSVRGLADADDLPSIPIANRAFDKSNNGVSVPVATGLALPIIHSRKLGAIDSSDLQKITGLDDTVTHWVVALGLGNNSSIIGDAINVTSATFSEAPFYADVKKPEYGRFLLLFHVATDANDDQVPQASEVFSEARFVGVLDAAGNWLDSEYAQSTGQL